MFTFACVERTCGTGRTGIGGQRGGFDPILRPGSGLGMEIGVKRICGMRSVPPSKESSVLLGLACANPSWVLCLLTGDTGLLLISAFDRGVGVDIACQGGERVDGMQTTCPSDGTYTGGMMAI